MDDLESRVHSRIAEDLGLDIDMVSPEKDLIEDLGADSLDRIELIMALEADFDIEIDEEKELPGLTTVEDFVAIVRAKTLAQAA